MKKILAILLTLVLSPAFFSHAADIDGEGHVLVKLWLSYKRAEVADTPKKAAEALEKIKAEAVRQHLTWDYYDACNKYVSVRARSNWKLRDSLQKAFRAEIEAFGEPIAVYHMRRGEDQKALLPYLKANQKALKAGKNEQFWKADWRLQGYRFSGALLPLLKNDWDYCLWSLFPSEMMSSEYKFYPLKAFAEYQALPYGKERGKQLKAFSQRWEGKAAALFAREDLLQGRMADLQGKGSSEQYKALRADCTALISEAKAFKGEEKKIADCCTVAASLVEQLDSKSISAEIKDSRMTLTLQNVESVSIRIFNGDKKVSEFLQANPICSYYAPDRLELPLPSLADGSYTVKCVSDKLEETFDWDKYTISVATRWNTEGIGIWAADYNTGEPLENVDVELIKDDKVLKTCKGFRLQGFTTLPQEIAWPLRSDEKHNLSLRVRLGSRASTTLWPGSYNSPDIFDKPGQMQAIILTDRSAFQPDETVHFKAIVYKGKYSYRAAAGLGVKAVLRDAQNNVLEEKELKTNAFGSVAGDFILRRSERNGNYSIRLYCGNESLGAKALTVDDFVLPTFDLTFDKLPVQYLPLDSVTVKGFVKAYSGHSLAGADISWNVRKDGLSWASGKIVPEKDRFSLKFPVDSADASARRGGSYGLTVKVTDVTGETMEFQQWIYVRDRYETKVPQKEYFFEDLEGPVGTRIVAGKTTTWAVAELYGTADVLLDKCLLEFSPSGDASAETTLAWDYSDSWPETLRLNIIYFQNGKTFRHTLYRSRENHSCDLPLSFERFLDTTSPGAQYTFTLKTIAGAEVAATVFDKSTERFRANGWKAVEGRNRPSPSVRINASNGRDTGGWSVKIMGRSAALMTKASGSRTYDSLALNESVEEAAVFQKVDQDSPGSDIPIREDFATTIAWEPFLKASADGTVQFTFTNSDKLSTYYVQVFAHDAAMHNEALRREMVVTIPVKISLVEPKLIYEGDTWVVRVGLSSSLIGDVDGTLNVSLMDGSSWKTARVLHSETCSLTVPGRAACSRDVSFSVPAGIRDLGIKVTFVPDRIASGADGVFVSVPVLPAAQTLTEAHSGVLLSGADRSALEALLRSQFVGVDGAEASLKEVDIRQMLREALPGELPVRCDDAISQARALYSWSLLKTLRSKTGEGAGASTASEQVFDRDAAVKKLLACRCEGGGFAWFAGMKPSPLVTAVVLRLLHGQGIIDEESAVHYIDREFFRKDKSGWWWRGLTMQQYIFTRSYFPQVSFKEKTDAAFRKEARAWLVPRKTRGLNGRIAAKARRVLTLDNLLTLEGGTALASKMGIRLGTACRLRKSLNADIASLAEYAQPHSSGGIYYPNAVMPWRGLLETELDAHCELIDIMDSQGHPEIANGIRLWIMLQKETQYWKQSPGFIEALAAVLNGPESVLDTKVLALSATYTRPFAEIAATGNGMAIAAEAPAGAGASVAGLSAPSSPTGSGNWRIGERVRLSWTLRSDENRSFVKVTLPYGAGLVPVNQKSGYRGGCYRSMKPGCIELWYESFPEEKTVISEEFYVTRAGEFQAPVAQIECEYAPHYRANDAWRGRCEISVE